MTASEEPVRGYWATADELDKRVDEMLGGLDALREAAAGPVGPKMAERLNAHAVIFEEAIALVRRAAGQHRAGKGPTS